MSEMSPPAGQTEFDASPDAERSAENPPSALSEENEFGALGLSSALVQTLSALGYEEPTPIQREAIPALLSGGDVIGQAATGTGKTAAFALPILQRLSEVGADSGNGRAPSALVLVPTRELAMQVSEALHKYGRSMGARVVPVYGGAPIGRQLDALRRGVDVVVATPGRAVDHLNRGTLDLGYLSMLVLDEADEMLDMGFLEDIEGILNSVVEGCQTVLFSATMPSRISTIAKRYLQKPQHIQIAAALVAPGAAPKVRQTAYVVPRSHKAAALGRVLDIECPTAAIVFCRTRIEVDELTETLNGRGYRAEALHGGLSQEQRDRVMSRVRNGSADLLVATDVAARGLDVEHLTHVVNYDIPNAPEAYVHRIGRVGRAGREGVAITLAEPRQHRLLKNIERTTKQKIAVEKVPTAADLASRRMELTEATLRETLLEADSDHVRGVVDSLTDEFDIVEIALAAIRLLHEAHTGAGDEAEIPDASAHMNRDRDRENSKGDRFGKRQGSEGGKYDNSRGGRPEGGRGSRPGQSDRAQGPSEGMTRLFVGSGRLAGIRPKDLVGAIAGESGIAGREIGSIQIADRFSLVEVPTEQANRVLAAMKGTTIQGQRVNFRRERDDNPKHRGKDGKPASRK